MQAWRNASSPFYSGCNENCLLIEAQVNQFNFSMLFARSGSKFWLRLRHKYFEKCIFWISDYEYLICFIKTLLKTFKIILYSLESLWVLCRIWNSLRRAISFEHIIYVFDILFGCCCLFFQSLYLCRFLLNHFSISVYQVLL